MAGDAVAPSSLRGGVATARRPRLVVAATFPVHPPSGGGQVRAAHLYRGLSDVFDVELVTLGGVDTPERVIRPAPGVTERVIAKSPSHAAREREFEKAAGTIVTDIAMVELYAETPAYLAALRDAVRGARAVVACHPYAFPAIRAVTDLPVWYEAQDVEALLKRDVLGSGAEGQRLLSIVEQVEQACSTDAEFVWACSVEDRAELVGRYAVDAARVLVVPNGVAVDEVGYVDAEIRAELRRSLHLTDRYTALFLASWHEPNVLGARELVSIARDLPDVDFMILGSVGLALAGWRLGDNVHVTGQVSHGFKDATLAVADVALNPVCFGSGTNLKMLEYFAAGVPVISTAFGARGLGVEPGRHYIEAEPAAFPAALRRLRSLPLDDRAALVDAARQHTERAFAWSSIVRDLIDAIGARRNGSAVSPPAVRGQ